MTIAIIPAFNELIETKLQNKAEMECEVKIGNSKLEEGRNGTCSDNPIIRCDVVMASLEPSFDQTLAERERRFAIELLSIFTMESSAWDETSGHFPFSKRC